VNLGPTTAFPDAADMTNGGRAPDVEKAGPLDEHDRTSFFRELYLGFGPAESLVDRCVERAYRDFNGTWHGARPNQLQRKERRTKCRNLITTSLLELNGTSPDQVHFDQWHSVLRARLRAASDPVSTQTGLTVGQTQKWINMAIKYTVAANVSGFEALETLGHIPIDRVLVKVLARDRRFADVQLLRNKSAWSKLADDQIYEEFQATVRRIVAPESPLVYEFRNWMKEQNAKPV
jgi:hypothetical protein